MPADPPTRGRLLEQTHCACPSLPVQAVTWVGEDAEHLPWWDVEVHLRRHSPQAARLCGRRKCKREAPMGGWWVENSHSQHHMQVDAHLGPRTMLNSPLC
jgi:hypothetical protein